MCLRSSAPVVPDLRAGLDAGRRGAVAPQVLVPDRARSAATTATRASVRIPTRRPATGRSTVNVGALTSPAGAAVGRRTQIVSAGDAGFVKAFVMGPWSQIHAGACNLHAVACRFDRVASRDGEPALTEN